jgi:hypothetical protein
VTMTTQAMMAHRTLVGLAAILAGVVDISTLSITIPFVREELVQTSDRRLPCSRKAYSHL